MSAPKTFVKKLVFKVGFTLLFVLLKNPIIGGIHFYNSSIKRIIHEKKNKSFS